MHRRPLLGLLRDYSDRHPEEGPCVGRFLEFVEREEECFERHLASGHVTGSAWIVSPDGGRALLTHHRKLDCWLQLGGHADGDPDVLAVALREAREESGIGRFQLLGEGIFDLDIHPIPARGAVAGHLHYDVRWLLRAESEEYAVSEESHDLRWVEPDQVAVLSGEESMLRMARKWLAWRAQA